MGLTQNQKKDYQKYFIKKPTGFSPEYNNYVIDKCIKEAEERKRQKDKILKEAIGERADALGDYFMHLNRNPGKSLEKYFGIKELARLKGKEIKEAIMENNKGFLKSYKSL